MRKITLLLAMAILACMSQLSAKTATTIPSYIVNETFTGVSSYPATWSTGTALYGANGGVSWLSPAANQLNETGSGSGNRGLTHNFTSSGTEPLVYVDFDWFITSCNTGQRNAFGFTLDDAASTVATPLTIMCLYFTGTDKKFHYANQDLDTIAFSTGGSFTRASAVDTTGTNGMNLGTQLNFPWSLGTWYNIQATLDFTNKTVNSLTITNKTNGTSFTVSTVFPFMTNAASITNVSKISLFNSRSNNSGKNGDVISFNTSIDNFKTYKLIDAPTSTVTVNYLDPSGSVIKTASTVTNQAIGSTYTALPTDKVTYNDGKSYYVYDALNTLSDNVVVLADGTAQINLKFLKTAVTPGTYNWLGMTSGNWNEADTNFSTDGVNSLGYQAGNGTTFSYDGFITAVLVNDYMNLGTGSLTVSSPGYAFFGTGTLNGSGSLNINLSGTQAISLGVINNMTGVTQLAGGTITLTQAGTLGSRTVVNGPVDFISNYAIPATTFNASSTIEATSGTSIGDMTTAPGTKVTVLSSYNTSNSLYAFSFSPATTFGGELELDGNGTDTRFGMRSIVPGYFATGKVTLKGSAFLFVDAAQTAATTINIGTLTGDSGTRLGWGKTIALGNDITWSVGALNENSTFAGTLTNIGAYAGSGSFYTGNLTNFIKEGTGTLTLSGIANTHNGNFTVNGGNLNVTGAIGNATSVVSVASAGTLSGTGAVGGATTINGTLAGSLVFGSSLTLAGTTNLTVNGFTPSQFDSIQVAGAVTNGGTLNIAINTTLPSDSVSIRLLKAATYGGTFATVNVTAPANSSANWVYNQSTGILSYKVSTGVNTNTADKISVYPTLTHGIITIAGGNAITVEIANLTGQLVKQVSFMNGKTSVSLSDLATGSYLVKVISTDGSVKVQKIIYQK